MDKFLGCSGYYYDEWKELFYPKGLAKTKWLAYYATHFNSLELNTTFYHLPKPSSIQRWKEITPEEFTFSVKGNRYITHTKKLHEVNESVKTFYELVYPMEEKLGAVLWQLQESFQRNDERLEAFCKSLSNEFLNVIEFRHPSWKVPEVFDILDRYELLCCTLSSPLDIAEKLVVQNGTAYLRFHGKKEWYKDLYTTEELKKWAKELHKHKLDRLFVFFNNTFHGHALENCREFRALLQ